MVSSNQLREKLTHMLWQKRIGNKIRVLDASYNYDQQNDGYKDFYQQYVHNNYIVINIFLLISIENNRAIYPCICMLIKKVYIALVASSCNMIYCLGQYSPIFMQ